MLNIFRCFRRIVGAINSPSVNCSSNKRPFTVIRSVIFCGWVAVFCVFSAFSLDFALFSLDSATFFCASLFPRASVALLVAETSRRALTNRSSRRRRSARSAFSTTRCSVVLQAKSPSIERMRFSIFEKKSLTRRQMRAKRVLCAPVSSSITRSLVRISPRGLQIISQSVYPLKYVGENSLPFSFPLSFSENRLTFFLFSATIKIIDTFEVLYGYRIICSRDHRCRFVHRIR